jgi:hypothetical protein
VPYIKVDAFDVVIGGTEYTGPDSYVELKDHATGYTGPGSYHIQIQAGGLSGYSFKVTEGLAPCDSSSLMTLGRVVLTPPGELIFADKRKLNVGMTGVNATILQTPVDGSYLADDVVQYRNIQGGASGLLDHLGMDEGDILVRGATAWEVLAPGTSTYVLTSNGTGAVPSWEAASGGGGVTSINTETGDVVIESTSSSLAVTEPDGTHINLDLTAIADARVLANTSGSSGVPVATTLSALIDKCISNTQGVIIYRGSSGWAALSPGTDGDVLTTHGASADPTWETGGGGGSGTVTEVDTGTGLTGGPITTTGTVALASASDSTIKSNISGGSAAPTDNTLTGILDHILGSTQGSVIYRGASTWSLLGPGTSGQFLKTSGASANPSWSSVSGTGLGVIYGTGVPSSSSTQTGQLYVATDGYPKMREFTYDNSYSGLPYIVNRGIALVSATGVTVVAMERTVTSGNLLVAMGAGWNGTSATTQSGWTQIFNNSGPAVCPFAAYKYATGADTTESPFSFLSVFSQIVCIVEIANAPASSPIAQSANGDAVTVTGLTANQLILFCSGQSSLYSIPTIHNGSSINLWEGYSQISGGAYVLAMNFRALPFISKYTWGVTSFQSPHGGIIVIGTGSGTTNYWHPIA